MQQIWLLDFSNLEKRMERLERMDGEMKHSRLTTDFPLSDERQTMIRSDSTSTGYRIRTKSFTSYNFKIKNNFYSIFFFNSTSFTFQSKTILFKSISRLTKKILETKFPIGFTKIIIVHLFNITNSLISKMFLI